MSSIAGAREQSRIRVGVDIQAISRFDAHSEPLRDAIRDRVFTETERAYCDRQRDPQQHYAARWAAKEAFVKLLDADETVPYSTVAVTKDGVKPSISLDSDARAALCRSLGADSTEDIAIDLSLSHDRDTDAALAEITALKRGDRHD